MKRVISYIIFVLIIFSLPFVNKEYKQKEKTKTKLSFTLADVNSIFSNAVEFVEVNDRSYHAVNDAKSVVGNFIVSNNFIQSNFGYAGEVNVLIGFNDSKIVEGVVLLDNVESRDYVRSVNQPQFMGLWNGKSLTDVPTMNIDAVSGATFTSNAVIRAVKESTASYLSLVASYKVSAYEILKISLFALVIILSLIVSLRKNMSRFRIIYLILIVAIAGVILQNMLSIALFSGWMKQGVSLSNSWMSVTLLAMALVMPALGKIRYYCTYLCPMGAIQELAGKISPFKKISLRFLKYRYFDMSDIFLLLIVAAMFSSITIDFTYVEPFAAYAIDVVSWGMLAFGGIVILSSLFFTKPWCAICPTGCALNKLHIPNIKKKVK